MFQFELVLFAAFFAWRGTGVLPNGESAAVPGRKNSA
jgi:hypothetical protein